MFEALQPCYPKPSPYQTGCCPSGFECTADAASPSGHSCAQLPAAQQTYEVAGLVAADLGAAPCTERVPPGGSCGGDEGPRPGACCPDGFTCKPAAGGPADGAPAPGGYACQADNAAPTKAAVAAAAAARASGVRALGVPPLPAKACICRRDNDGSKLWQDCPSAFSHPAGTTRVPPPLAISKKGALGLASGAPLALRGVNWFGWEDGQHVFDGLWAYCDDNSGSCPQDGEVPPWSFPSAAIGADGQNSLQLFFWKRRMTGDFATVVWRLKLLGINAIRMPFLFSALDDDLGPYSDFYACVNDPEDYIAKRTVDPAFGAAPSSLKLPAAFSYMGMAHPPPPPAAGAGDAKCSRPWSAPFLDSYTDPKPRAEWGSTLNFTMCNWYLPSGPGVLGVHRAVWQIEYLVSQGFYVLLDYHPFSKDPDANVQTPSTFASNWASFYSAIMASSNWSYLKGRVAIDLVNEASQYKCQWDRACATCAKGSDLISAATTALRALDPNVVIMTNGMGQDGVSGCAGFYAGMSEGDGFITDSTTVKGLNLADPSFLFQYSLSDSVARQRAAAPHVYPTSITKWDPGYDSFVNSTTRWSLSWGRKAQGLDKLSDGTTKIPKSAVVLGEFGARDFGDNTNNNSDTTIWTPTDVAWLQSLGSFAASRMGSSFSWFFWSWNANSGDTAGLVGPATTWREIQWTKVQMLVRSFGLNPWFCAASKPPVRKAYGCK